jgi:hypothetical protein
VAFSKTPPKDWEKATVRIRRRYTATPTPAIQKSIPKIVATREAGGVIENIAMPRVIKKA